MAPFKAGAVSLGLLLCIESDSCDARRRRLAPALIGEETELTEKVHLVEEQVLGLQRVAVGEIDSRPPELNGSSCRRDITVGGVEHAIMGARQGPFGRCGWPVGEELLDLKAEVRERFLEHTQEANDVVATAGLAAWRHQLGIGGPRLSVAVTVVDGGDVPEDHVFGVGHQLSNRRWRASLSDSGLPLRTKARPTLLGTFPNARPADVPLAQPGQLFDPGMTRAQFRLDSMPESASAAARPAMRGCSRLLLDPNCASRARTPRSVRTGSSR